MPPFKLPPPLAPVGESEPSPGGEPTSLLALEDEELEEDDDEEELLLLELLELLLFIPACAIDKADWA